MGRSRGLRVTSLCRLSTIQDLIDCRVYTLKSRRRVKGGLGVQAGYDEARALVYQGTGEVIGDKEELQIHVAALRQHLALEASGRSACGECDECLTHRQCTRAANKEIARHKEAARFAEEGPGLVGRQFWVRY